jgi:hypothetical protein
VGIEIFTHAVTMKAFGVGVIDGGFKLSPPVMSVISTRKLSEAEALVGNTAALETTPFIGKNYDMSVKTHIRYTTPFFILCLESPNSP